MSYVGAWDVVERHTALLPLSWLLVGFPVRSQDMVKRHNLLTTALTQNSKPKTRNSHKITGFLVAAQE